jgi:hypothetical protein
MMLAGQLELAAGDRLVRDQPAGHGDFEDLDQVRALLEVTFERQRIVTWIKWTRRGQQIGHANPVQKIARVQAAR